MPQTVLEAIETVLPFGTDRDYVTKAFSGKPGRKKRTYNNPPYSPFDLFAVVGHLIEIGGGYHWIVAAKHPVNAPTPSVGITRTALKRLEKQGREWSTQYKIPAEVESLWGKLLSHGEEPVSTFATGLSHTLPKPPKWLDPAYKLFIIADCASEGVGYWADANGRDADRFVVNIGNRALNDFVANEANGHVRLSRQVVSITTAAVDDDVVCVQPKARTSMLGCSLRNLSQNLSLLPPRGKINACWIPPWQQKLNEHQADSNVLLIPFPYKLEHPSFNPHSEFASSEGNWGWFELDQNWLPPKPEEFIEFVDLLIERASSSTVVNGLMFPEYSLSYKHYEKLAEHIRTNHKGIEFIVAGSRDNCESHVGNHALSTHYYDDPKSEGNGRTMVTASRPKHHRWALDGGQIETYGLKSCFPPNSESQKWWEKIPLPPRQIHFHPVRSGSVYSVLICEDLARTDPVHDPMKSVGPNLVFVILFDGPQLEWRWSMRQATSLAEDPGSSVLTLTSRALVDRWNVSHPPGHADHSWAVATWKDTKHRARLIDCPPGVEAVLAKLRGRETSEYSLDGRVCNDSFEWQMLDNGITQISLDRSKSRHVELLKIMGAG